MSDAEVVERAVEAIGAGRPDDFILAPSTHAEELAGKAPALAALLRTGKIATLARQYERRDRDAGEAQTRFKEAMLWANAAVLATGVLGRLHHGGRHPRGGAGRRRPVAAAARARPLRVGQRSARLDVAVPGARGQSRRGVDERPRARRERSPRILRDPGEVGGRALRPAARALEAGVFSALPARRAARLLRPARPAAPAIGGSHAHHRRLCRRARPRSRRDRPGSSPRSRRRGQRSRHSA